MPSGSPRLRAVLLPLLIWACAQLSGCASITSGSEHSLSIDTHDGKGTRVKGAQCALRNRKGQWTVTTPATANITGAPDNLLVHCEADGFDAGMASVISTVKTEMFGNILIGGLIGVAIDHTSGSAYAYPPNIRVRMGESIMVQPARTRTGHISSHANPEKLPARSDWASLEDVERVPTTESGRNTYRQFLEAPMPRAIAFSREGSVGWSRNVANAADIALQRCERNGRHACQLYAIDNYVVWTGEYPDSSEKTATPPLRPVARTPADLWPASNWGQIDDLAVMPLKTERGQTAYREFLSATKPRAFAIGQNGTWAFASGHRNAESDALNRCASVQKLTCRLYAIDDRVVWTSVFAGEVAAATVYPQEKDEAQGEARALADFERVPHLTPRGRTSYQEFLAARSPRAFALSASGSYGWSSTRADAPERALQYCQRQSRVPCRLYAIDERVVWPQIEPSL